MHTPEEMEIEMLKKIYRAIVLAQTASAAVKVVARMTDAQLSDIGSLEKRNSRVSSSLSAATLLNHAFLQTSRT